MKNNCSATAMVKQANSGMTDIIFIHDLLDSLCNHKLTTRAGAETATTTPWPRSFPIAQARPHPPPDHETRDGEANVFNYIQIFYNPAPRTAGDFRTVEF